MRDNQKFLIQSRIVKIIWALLFTYLFYRNITREKLNSNLVDPDTQLQIAFINADISPRFSIYLALMIHYCSYIFFNYKIF